VWNCWPCVACAPSRPCPDPKRNARKTRAQQQQRQTLISGTIIFKEKESKHMPGSEKAGQQYGVG
jgi:hypothetical protein